MYVTWYVTTIYIHIWTDTIVHDCGESSCDGGLIVGCVHTIVPLGHLIACGKYFVVSMACSMQHLVSSLSSAQLDGLPLCHPAPELMPRLDGMHLNADTAEPLARAQLSERVLGRQREDGDDPLEARATAG